MTKCFYKIVGYDSGIYEVFFKEKGSCNFFPVREIFHSLEDAEKCVERFGKNRSKFRQSDFWVRHCIDEYDYDDIKYEDLGEVR